MCLEDELVYTFYDDFQKGHMLSKGASKIGTGFVSATTSLVIDGDDPLKVWIAGDFRVRAFALNGFEELDLLYVGDPQAVKEGNNNKDVIIRKSALAIWQDLVVLGHGQHLTFWKRYPGQSASIVEGWDWQGPADPLVIAVDRNRGRQRVGFAEILMDNAKIDCLATAHDFLAIASSAAPTIHIVRRSKGKDDATFEVICRLIGHTMGVTALVSRVVKDDAELVSGSADGSIKIWSLSRQEMLFSLQKETGKRAEVVTALHIGKWKEPVQGEALTFLFVGHLDKTVRVWDLFAKRMMFELTTGPEPIIPQKPVPFMPAPRNMGSQVALASVPPALARMPPGFPFPFLFSFSLPSSVPQEVSKPSPTKEPEPEGRELIPKAIGFNHTPRQERCELFIIAVEPGEGLKDGELQWFQFPASESKR
jgi:hypothetical protein